MTRNYYSTMDGLWLETLDDLLRVPSIGSRDGDAREILGWRARFPAERNWLWCPSRRLSAAYAAAELLWYLSGSDDGAVMTHYAPQYARFLEPDGRAHGAYGKRIADYDQLMYCHELLKHDPNTRQAIVTMWSRRDISTAARGECKDIPCTLSLQFLLRDGKLNLISTMRSNDAWLGLPYDAWCFGEILKIMATSLRVPAGWVQHQVGSMHLYERNVERARIAVNSGVTEEWDQRPRRQMPTRFNSWLQVSMVVKSAVIQEAKMRSETFEPGLCANFEQMGCVGEWLAVLAVKNGYPRPVWLDSRL